MLSATPELARKALDAAPDAMIIIDAACGLPTAKPHRYSATSTMKLSDTRSSSCCHGFSGQMQRSAGAREIGGDQTRLGAEQAAQALQMRSAAQHDQHHDPHWIGRPRHQQPGTIDR
jgi:hypothetical protein